MPADIASAPKRMPEEKKDSDPEVEVVVLTPQEWVSIVESPL